MTQSNDNNPLNDPLKAAGAVLGGAFLLSPLGLPILRGASRLAIAGLGVYAAGSLAGKAADTLMDFVAASEEDEDRDDNRRE